MLSVTAASCAVEIDKPLKMRNKHMQKPSGFFYRTAPGYIDVYKLPRHPSVQPRTAIPQYRN
eukprot:4067479-Karenia_brevis.AAC.1